MTLGDAYCKPIRSKPLADITVDDILAVLRPVWNTVPETARRVRMRLEKVLDAARVRGLRTGDNPARWKGHLDHVLPKHSKSSRGHHAALPWSEMPQFMVRLAALPGTTAKAMRLLILTAARTTEVLNAQWSEFDLENKYDVLHKTTIQDFTKKDEYYDLIMCVDVLEHLYLSEAIDMIECLTYSCRYIIIAWPTDVNQDCWEGNPYEKHKSNMTLSDLTRFNIVHYEKTPLDQFMYHYACIKAVQGKYMTR